MEENNCPKCIELERQLAKVQEENRQMRLEIERLRKVLENIAFSASAAVLEKFQNYRQKYNKSGDVIFQCNKVSPHDQEAHL
jgi:regulator of replication initiation timing